MWESIIKCTAVNSSSFCSSSLFKGRAESVMVLGRSAAGRGTREFLLPEICSGVEISTLTLNVHTQQTSEAGGKKKKKKSRDDLIWIGGVSEAEAPCQLTANQIWMKIAGSPLHQQSPACLSPVFSHMGTILSGEGFTSLCQERKNKTTGLQPCKRLVKQCAGGFLVKAGSRKRKWVHVLHT